MANLLVSLRLLTIIFFFRIHFYSLLFPLASMRNNISSTGDSHKNSFSFWDFIFMPSRQNFHVGVLAKWSNPISTTDDIGLCLSGLNKKDIDQYKLLWSFITFWSYLLTHLIYQMDFNLKFMQTEATRCRKKYKEYIVFKFEK